MIEQVALFENEPEDLDCKSHSFSKMEMFKRAFQHTGKQKQRQTYRVFDLF